MNFSPSCASFEDEIEYNLMQQATKFQEVLKKIYQRLNFFCFAEFKTSNKSAFSERISISKTGEIASKSMLAKSL